MLRLPSIISINSLELPRAPQRSQQSLKFPSTTRSYTRAVAPPKAMTAQNHGIRRYLVGIEYIGTRFSGSQQQLNCRTVVGVLEKAFHQFIGQPVSIFCSSRTDAGVHALFNVCHVDIERISKRKPGEVLPPHEPAVVRKAVNHFLQLNFMLDIKLKNGRSYFYRLLSGPEPLPVFERDRAWHVEEELDVLAMQKACDVLIGYHDFSSFRASGCQANSPLRTLDELHVSEVASSLSFPSIIERQGTKNLGDDLVDHSKNIQPLSSLNANHNGNGNFNFGADLGFGTRRKHHCYVITARSRSFLYHQVRLMVGVLKSVGTGDISISDVQRILDAKTITAACPMAPAFGLYLGTVKYDESSLMNSV